MTSTTCPSINKLGRAVANTPADARFPMTSPATDATLFIAPFNFPPILESRLLDSSVFLSGASGASSLCIIFSDILRTILRIPSILPIIVPSSTSNSPILINIPAMRYIHPTFIKVNTNVAKFSKLLTKLPNSGLIQLIIVPNNPLSCSTGFPFSSTGG